MKRLVESGGIKLTGLADNNAALLNLLSTHHVEFLMPLLRLELDIVRQLEEHVSEDAAEPTDGKPVPGAVAVLEWLKDQAPAGACGDPEFVFVLAKSIFTFIGRSCIEKCNHLLQILAVSSGGLSPSNTNSQLSSPCPAGSPPAPIEGVSARWGRRCRTGGCYQCPAGCVLRRRHRAGVQEGAHGQGQHVPLQRVAGGV